MSPRPKDVRILEVTPPGAAAIIITPSAISGDTVKKLERFRDKVNFKRQDACGELGFWNNNTVCPKCTQSIDETFRLDKISKLEEDIVKYRANVEELEEAVNAEEQRYAKFLGFQNEITTINNEISQHNIHLSTTTKLKKDLEKEIQSITDKLENRTVENDKLEEYKTRLKDILSELTELKDDHEYLDQSKALMNDDGVKTLCLIHVDMQVSILTVGV